MTRPPWYVMLLASGVELRCRARSRDMPDAPTPCPVVDHSGVVEAIVRRASAAVARAAAVPRADGAYRRSTRNPFSERNARESLQDRPGRRAAQAAKIWMHGA